jgi:hypothetical protein
VALTIFGALQPRQHSASRALRVARSPAEVWSVITDFASWPTWRKDVRKMERLPDQSGHPVWVEIGKNGRLPLEIAEQIEHQRLVTRIADPQLPFSGSWTYVLSTAESDCVVRITEQGEVKNPLFRAIAKLFMNPAGSIESYLRSLADRFGEPARIDP